LAQALLLGSAVLVLSLAGSQGMLMPDGYIDIVRLEIVYLVWLLAISSLLHLLMVWGEISLTHPTAHARIAIWEMVRGRYRTDFWIAILLSILGCLLPFLAIVGTVSYTIGVAGAPIALIGLMLYENAYVQAGQSVPLA
jgi:hypothetical protein